jgi:hypothetical protein
MHTALHKSFTGFAAVALIAAATAFGTPPAHAHAPGVPRPPHRPHAAPARTLAVVTTRAHAGTGARVTPSTAV